MQLPSRLTGLLIGLTLALICGIWMFSSTILSYTAYLSLKTYSHYYLGGSFQAEEISWKEGCWSFKTPSFIGKEQTKKWIVVRAEEMRIAPSFHFLHKQVGCPITLYAPTVEIEKIPENISKTSQGSSSHHGLWQIVPALDIQKGTMIFHNRSNGEQGVFAIHGSGSKKEGNFTVSSAKQGTCQLTYDGLEGEISFDHMEIADINNALQTIGFRHFPTHVRQGLLTGKIEFEGDEEEIPAVLGTLCLQDCSFENASGDMHGYIPEAFIKINQSIFTGEILLKKGGFLEYAQEGKPPIAVSGLEGIFSLPAYDRCQMQASGLCMHHGETFNLTIQGGVTVPGHNQGSCEVKIILENENRKPIQACFSSQREDFGHSQCDLDIQNVGAKEWDLLMLALGTQDIGLAPYTLRKGLIDARLKLDLENFKIKKIMIEELEALDIAFDLDQSNIFFTVDEAKGHLSLELSDPNILNTLQGAVSVHGGAIYFPGFNRQQWHLANLETNLSIEDGVLKKSFVDADFMGLKGAMEVDWASNKAVSLEFKGKVEALSAFAPTSIEKCLSHHFQENDIHITADVWHAACGLNVEGDLSINNQQENTSEQTQFGFILQKMSDNYRLLSPAAVVFSKQLGSDVLQAVAKSLIKQEDEPTAEWLKEELRIAGFSLKNGWFQASHLPCEKYLAPLMFREDQMTLSGQADMQGRFDCDGLAVEYQGRRIILENEDLAFDMGDIGFDEPARHYFDFLRDTDYGTVPVLNGAYFEKNSGLLFVDVTGTMQLKNKEIHIPHLTTNCNQVQFAGAIDFDYRSPEKQVFDVDVKTQKIEGSYSDVCILLSHFNPTANLELPLEGKISMLPPGGRFHFAFRPSGCKVEATMQGKLDSGNIRLPIKGVSLERLGFNFDYNHHADTLSINQIEGSLFFGDEKEALYTLENGNVVFSNIKKGEAIFDLSFFEKDTESLRLAGSTKPHCQNQDDLLQIALDPLLSHYHSYHPQKALLALNSEKEIRRFEIKWPCQLFECAQDLHKIGIPILRFYSPSLAEQSHDLSIPRGTLNINIDYEHTNRQFDLRLDAKNVATEKRFFGDILLAAAKKRNTWFVEQLQIGKTTLAAEIVPQLEGLQISFLGIRHGDLLLTGLEGFYAYKKMAFEGRINLLDVDFSRLEEWQSFSELVHDYAPQGQMKGTGTIQITADNEWPPHVEVNLTSSIKNAKIRNLHFNDTDQIYCLFCPYDKLIFKDCKSGLKCHSTGSLQGQFHVDTAIYDFKKEELKLNNLQFQADQVKLNWIADHLEKEFPDVFTPAITTIIRQIKEEGSFNGAVDLLMSDDFSLMTMRLPQGKYILKGREHEINHFVMQWDKKTLQAMTQYRFQDTLYWVTVRSTTPDIDAGEIIVTASKPQENFTSAEEGLRFSWYMHPQHGMVVEKATGRLPGVHIDLVRDRLYPMNPYSWHLDGQIWLDPDLGKHILPPDLVEAISSWNIGRNYALSGKWIFMLDEPHDGELYFEGKLKGDKVILKGHVLESISADLNCTPTRIEITDFVVQDRSGRLSVPSAIMQKQTDEFWWVYVPKIAGAHFRPSLLRKMNSTENTPKPLFFSSFEIENLSCRADDLSTMTGTGKLTFNNSSKKPLQNPLLAIPAEIISRIGLNLDVLSPVSGTIFFSIDDYKIKLNRFKDVYSEGKLSKFYLPNNQHISYVDLDGNVHAQVRMKQYNLLFKLAELFTVTVHGTLQKPVYTLQKQ